MKFRIDVVLPEFDYDNIEGHDVEEQEHEECEMCGECHDPEQECESKEMISTSPIKELIKGTHAGLMKKIRGKKDK